jgi:hypothetical protein
MAGHRDLSQETMLRRTPFAEALTEAGHPITPATLATMAVRGGGPQMEYWGRIPLYRWGPGLKWAQGRLSGPVRSTAEAAEVRRAKSGQSEAGERRSRDRCAPQTETRALATAGL